MIKKCSLIASAVVCMAVAVSAQTQPCGTDEHHQHLLKTYPKIADYEQQFNEQLGRGLAAKTTGSAIDTTYFDVPIVVHIVHDYGAENLSDNEIYDAAANWALAFVKKNSDTAAVIEPFKKYIGDARMRLHLATIDPDGNPTKGVIRHHSYLTNLGDDRAKFESWPNNRYINIWFVNSFGTSGAAAYAYYPSAGAGIPYYDGVISLASYIDRSKTIPHELGHVLNLQHVWGNNNNAAVACGDDQVHDTPPTKGHTPGCVLSTIYDTTCATGYARTYLSASGLVDSLVDYPDTTNAQNIMDYSYCSNMFSAGQCVRMREALTSSVAGRNNLITEANLAATGALAPTPDLPPVAEFILNKAIGAGTITDARSYFLTFNSIGEFSFRNASWNDTISSVLWQFSNGAAQPVSTNTGTVTNRFSVPGWVTTTLTATSNAGSNTIVNTRSVYAADTTVAGGLGYSQKFSSIGDIPNWPMMNYYNNRFQWEFYNGAGMGDNSCIRYKSFDSTNKRTGIARGDFDDIYTPAFNLNGVTGDVFVNFYTSGALVSGSSSTSRDSLQVDVSTNGGAIWTKIAGYRGTDLANNGAQSGNFIHGASSSWKSRSVSVPAVYRNSQTFFRLRFRPGNIGNNLYLDNFGISNLPAHLEEMMVKGANAFSVYPNPSSEGSTLVFNSTTDGIVKYSVRDVAGRVVYEAETEVFSNNINRTFIPRSAVPCAGLYFVTLTSGSINTTEKMLVY